MEKTMDKIVALAKGRGFVYPGSEIYGGLANSWDYGPLGVEFKNNVKRAWWQKFVQECPYNVGLDAAILMNPEVWVASGHVGGFNDPLMDCKSCKERFRADKLIEDYVAENGLDIGPVEAMSKEEMEAFIAEHIVCPSCGKNDFTPIRQFNLMFKTFQGVNEDTAAQIYLRPETAQGIFVNFKNVLRTTRRKMPMGIGQIGKSFRNEITPGNFIFRIREFEQMELEFFCDPKEEFEWFNYWKDTCHNWLLSTTRTLSCATMRRKSFPIIPTRRRTSSIVSPLAGASCGASRTARISTSRRTCSIPARASNISILPPGRNMFRTASSLLSVRTA